MDYRTIKPLNKYVPYKGYGEKMRKLTLEEIEKYASSKGVRRIAVENFLGTMGDNKQIAKANLLLDTRLYGWNDRTVNAIIRGINKASKED